MLTSCKPAGQVNHLEIWAAPRRGARAYQFLPSAQSSRCVQQPARQQHNDPGYLQEGLAALLSHPGLPSLQWSPPGWPRAQGQSGQGLALRRRSPGWPLQLRPPPERWTLFCLAGRLLHAAAHTAFCLPTPSQLLRACLHITLQHWQRCPADSHRKLQRGLPHGRNVFTIVLHSNRLLCLVA